MENLLRKWENVNICGPSWAPQSGQYSRCVLHWRQDHSVSLNLLTQKQLLEQFKQGAQTLTQVISQETVGSLEESRIKKKAIPEQ